MTRRYFDDDVRRANRRDTRPRDVRLLAALREWERLRLYTARLKRERTMTAVEGCENAPSLCFMQRGEGGEWMPLSERCPACKRSYALHQLAVKASLAAGKELRRLRRLLKGETDAVLRDQAGLRQAG